MGGQGRGPSFSSLCLHLRGTPVMVRGRGHAGGQAPVHPVLALVAVKGSPARREDQLHPGRGAETLAESRFRQR